MAIQKTENIWHNGKLIPWESANVHVMSPVDGGGEFGSPGLIWIVTVPRHVPVRKEVGPEGALGVAARREWRASLAVSCSFTRHFQERDE